MLRGSAFAPPRVAWTIQPSRGRTDARVAHRGSRHFGPRGVYRTWGPGGVGAVREGRHGCGGDRDGQGADIALSAPRETPAQRAGPEAVVPRPDPCVRDLLERRVRRRRPRDGTRAPVGGRAAPGREPPRDRAAGADADRFSDG